MYKYEVLLTKEFPSFRIIDSNIVVGEKVVETELEEASVVGTVDGVVEGTVGTRTSEAVQNN